MVLLYLIDILIVMVAVVCGILPPIAFPACTTAIIQVIAAIGAAAMQSG